MWNWLSSSTEVKTSKRKKKVEFFLLEIVQIQHHNMVVFIVLVQDLIQSYVMFLMLLVQVKNKIFVKRRFISFNSYGILG